MASFSQRSNPTVDRISDLPDSILCHILSFLPTKQAFTTSILSKRWKPVWLSILALNFDDQTFKDFKSFHKFVYSTMFKLRDKKTSIHSFSLKLKRYCFDQKQLNRIFKFVMERGGVNLNFDMYSISRYRFIKLPHSILSFKTLQVLKLTFLSIKDFDQVDFPQLKTLHLQTVRFKSQEFCVKFLFGCPVVEYLDIQNILYIVRPRSLVPMENVNALPNLVKVWILYSTERTPITLFCNAKVLHIEKISISRSWLLEVLPYFPKLQHFIIKDCVKVDDCWKDPQTAPECISSQLKTCCINGYKGTTYELVFVKYIMQHSKVLETMTVKSSTCLLKDQKDKMFAILSSSRRGSTTCKLLFD